MFKLLVSLLGGPAGVITGWFTSVAGKIIGGLALAAVISGVLGSIYFSWEHAIKNQEDLKLQVQQQQTIINNKNAEIKTLKDLSALQEKTQVDQTQDNTAINLQTDTINSWLAARDKTKDPVSSQILKDTFAKLKGAQ